MTYCEMVYRYYLYLYFEGWMDISCFSNGFFSKKIIGLVYGTHMTAELALKAFKNACLNVETTEGIILYFDFGSQYTSEL